MRTILSAFVAAYLALTGSPVDAQAASQEREINLRIDSETLAGALDQWAAQTGIHLISPSWEIAKKLAATPLRGRHTAREALEKLLSGTPLTVEWVSDKAVAIREKSAALESSGGRTDQPPIPVARLNGDEFRGFQSAAPDERVAQNRGQIGDGQAITRTDVTQVEEILVTGTHIRGASPTSPLIVLSRHDIVDSGRATVAEALLTVPANFGGGKNPSVLGASGVQNQSNVGYASSPNLRSLGPSSTLTLVNGYRMASSGFGGGVDLSVIPLSAIERVEVLTDGASAVYGSDAIGGVVNVILRKSFAGFETNLSLGDSTQGGADEQRINQLAGFGWETGNVLVDYEYSRQDALDSQERDFSAQAQVPTTLVPFSKANSALLSGSQELGSRASASVLGYFTDRNVRQPFGGFGQVFGQDIDVRQHGVIGSVEFRLPADWSLTPAGTVARDEVDQTQTDSLAASGAILAITNVQYTNRLNAAQVDAEGPLLRLPSGSVRAAVGAGHREQEYRQFNPTAPTSSYDASRDVEYVYAEVQVPLLPPSSTRPFSQRLDLSLAGRHEHYDGFGGTTNPKIGVVYRPSTDWTLQGTWGTSFKAPELDQQFIPSSGLFRFLPDPTSVSGATGALIVSNGNRELRPEESTSWSASLLFSPERAPGLNVRATYFEIDFEDRIARPITNTLSALSNPAFAPVVARSPTLAQVQATRDGLTNFFALGGPFNPANVGAIVTNWYQNVGLTTANGADVSVSVRTSTRVGSVTFAADASWLELEQRLLSTLPSQELDGTTFNPPSWRARAGITWSTGGFSSSLFVNYSGSELDQVPVPARRIPSWTTADLQLAYSFTDVSGLLSGTHIRLSALNILDKDPPALPVTSTLFPGIGYDSTNSSPLGRFLRIQLVKGWGSR